MRARIDVSEIEAKTKIRAKYLRALENEEWGLLPGPTFVKSFLRTYAQALGLDGKALVEEYRQRFEDPAEAALEPIVAGQQRSRARSGPGGRSPSGGPSRGYMAIVGVVLVVIILLIVGLVTNGGGSSSKSTSTRETVIGWEWPKQEPPRRPPGLREPIAIGRSFREARVLRRGAAMARLWPFQSSVRHQACRCPPIF